MNVISTSLELVPQNFNVTLECLQKLCDRNHLRTNRFLRVFSIRIYYKCPLSSLQDIYNTNMSLGI